MTHTINVNKFGSITVHYDYGSGVIVDVRNNRDYIYFVNQSGESRQPTWKGGLTLMFEYIEDDYIGNQERMLYVVKKYIKRLNS